jgi:hypothetical protein
MRITKITISLLLLIVGFLFNGELFILYLDNFQESYYQSRFDYKAMAKDVSDGEIISDFSSAGKEYDADFFLIDNKMESVYKKEIVIYGTDGAIEYLNGQGIDDNDYGSLFMGETSVRFDSFANIMDISNYDGCYFIGDIDKLDDLQAFSTSLMPKYGCGLPKLYGSDKETWLNISSVWAIIMCLILIMTWYGVIIQKKEIMIRIILGEDIKTIFLKNVLIDICVYAAFFAVIPAALSTLSNVYFKYSFVALLFTLLLLAGTIINSCVFIVDYRRDIVRDSNGRSLFFANYGIKILTTALAVIILSSNIVIIGQGYNMYKQRDFFESHKGYSHYILNYFVDNLIEKSDEDNDMMNQAFYERFYQTSLQYSDLSENFDSPYPVFLLNRAAMEEVLESSPIQGLAPNVMENGNIQILLPSNIAIDSNEYNAAKEICNAFFQQPAYSSPDITAYEGDVNLVGILNQGDKYVSRWATNPIIIFNNEVRPMNKSEKWFDMYYAYNIMYDVPREQFQDFIQEYQLTDQIVIEPNAMEVYGNNWAIIARNMKLVIILSIFILLLETVLIATIIRLEYRFNSTEMALKKVLGYSLFRRNSSLIIVTVISSLLGIIAAYILYTMSGLQDSMNVILSGSVFLVVEIVFILKKSHSVERETISTILKGERI